MKASSIFFLIILLKNVVNSSQFRFPCEFNSNEKHDHQKFLVLGTNDNAAAGLGNILSFFPAVYYFSLFTARDIVIHENSLLGKFCKVVYCSFPLVEEMAKIYPAVFTDYNINHQKIVSVKDFRERFDGKQSLYDRDIMITSTGIDAKSDWWKNYGNLTKCVSKLSGCAIGDITCSERHAYQSLINGPFNASHHTLLKSKIVGLNGNILQGILEVPNAYAPRYDIAIHIRNQFKSFEMGDEFNSDEAASWVQSEEAKEYFEKLLSYTLTFLRKARDRKKKISYAETFLNGTECLMIYLSADSSLVKYHIAKYFQMNEEFRTLPATIVMLSNTSIRHTKYTLNSDASLSFPLTVFDWYSLSLSDVIFTYRKALKGASTFVWSAARVSGSRDITNFDHGASVGTQAFQFHRDKARRLVLGRIWYFPNYFN